MLKKIFCLLIIISVSLFACGIFDPPGRRVVITVGNRDVSEDELKRDFRRIAFEMGINEEEIKDLINPLVDRIIDHYLIMEYGKANGIKVSDNELESAVKNIKSDYQEKLFQEMLLKRYIDFDAWKQGLKQQLFIEKIITKASESITPISFSEIKGYFDSHQNEFKHSQMIKLRQVVTSTRDEAEKVLQLLTKGEDLNELARKYSKAPEAENGGEMGWISKGALEESIEEVVFSLPIGKISSVIKTPYGFHIFEVISKRPEGFKSLPESMAEIEKKLTLQKKDAFYRSWLKELRSLFPVLINEGLLRTLEFG
jgi:parvulin-like peptidyl-prolyl isomerase